MSGIMIKNNQIMFYGNTAGYIEKDRAVVDPLFQCEELKDYLREKQGLQVEWTDGVFERLSSGRIDLEGNAQVLKHCRIHQLKPETNVMMKFIRYDELLKRFGEPDPDNYHVAYDGEVDTNDLEELCAKFEAHRPPGYEGHILAISDVVELYDNNGSAFYYIDKFDFKEINFKPLEQELNNGPVMGM